jgi:histone acetyltransferase (RNA polymerase elongator complex component)
MSNCNPCDENNCAFCSDSRDFEKLQTRLDETEKELLVMREELIDKYARLKELSRNNYESIVAEEFPIAESLFDKANASRN